MKADSHNTIAPSAPRDLLWYPGCAQVAW